ncbi:hypothetical protein K1719_045003 [Acacia pycnantha]|nr:hypothetical protein K1719_045003 [Acacia pycnantha]
MKLSSQNQTESAKSVCSTKIITLDPTIILSLPLFPSPVLSFFTLFYLSINQEYSDLLCPFLKSNLKRPLSLSLLSLFYKGSDQELRN